MEEPLKFPVYPDESDSLLVYIEHSPRSFRPNRVSESFIKALPRDLEGLLVYDIGAGSGVIGIVAAKRKAKIVYAVEPADENYVFLERNIKRNSVEDIVIPYQGEYFDPLEPIEKADIITADVSGIPEKFGRALGWYPEGIRTGGEKGTEITCELLRRALKHLKLGGKLYFPTADDLLNANEILNIAYKVFGKENVKNALCSDEEIESWKKSPSFLKAPWKSPEYVCFSLKENELRELESVHGSKFELKKIEKDGATYDVMVLGNLCLPTLRGHSFWRGRIHVATKV